MESSCAPAENQCSQMCRGLFTFAAQVPVLAGGGEARTTSDGHTGDSGPSAHPKLTRAPIEPEGRQKVSEDDLLPPMMFDSV